VAPVAKKGRRYSGNELLHMAECIGAGASVADVACLYGTKTDSMRDTLKRAGINVPDRSWTDAEMATLRQMRDAGHSPEDIASALPERSFSAVKGKMYAMRLLIGGVGGLPAAERVRIGLARAATGPAATPPVIRTCMCCRKPFGSAHVGNRRCERCLTAGHTMSSSYEL